MEYWGFLPLLHPLTDGKRESERQKAKLKVIEDNSTLNLFSLNTGKVQYEPSLKLAQ